MPGRRCAPPEPTCRGRPNYPLAALRRACPFRAPLSSVPASKNPASISVAATISAGYNPVVLPRRARDPRKAVSYTHLRAHETRHDLVCRLLLEKKKKKQQNKKP